MLHSGPPFGAFFGQNSAPMWTMSLFGASWPFATVKWYLPQPENYMACVVQRTDNFSDPGLGHHMWLARCARAVRGLSGVGTAQPGLVARAAPMGELLLLLLLLSPAQARSLAHIYSSKAVAGYDRRGARLLACIVYSSTLTN